MSLTEIGLSDSRRRTTGDLRSNFLIENSINIKPVKHVRFNDTVRIILVPCRQEYRQKLLHNLVWWSSSDYSSFKNQARDEILMYIKTKKCDLKTAISLLYQFGCPDDPNDESCTQMLEPEEVVSMSPECAHTINFLDVYPKSIGNLDVLHKINRKESVERTQSERHGKPLHPLALMAY
jgi:hypothetical protein